MQKSSQALWEYQSNSRKTDVVVIAAYSTTSRIKLTQCVLKQIVNFTESSLIFSLPPSFSLSFPLVSFLPLPHLSPITFSLATLPYLSFLGAPFLMQNSFFNKTGARLPKALPPGTSTPRKEVKAAVLRKGAGLPSESGVGDNDSLSLYQVITPKTENSKKGKLLFDLHIWGNFADSG